MKKLYILRHSYAIQNNNLADIDRPLDSQGIEFCSNIAQFIQQYSIKPELVLCSIAQRTRQTFELIEENLQTKFNVQYSQDLYKATSAYIYQLIKSIDNLSNNILIIGHNPYVSQLCNFLITSDHPVLSFGPGSLAYITFSINNWADINPNSGTLKGFLENE